ncbi:MAG: hypothetical protein KZQ95_16930 [Candidatus Thiodiazotropha sp. (ex Epidulcina cf. delphinae)]|nr:hypothetical protein [Candidatus Thiodiazotropha sp. (ex Epidulcina cf. delphinae)]
MKPKTVSRLSFLAWLLLLTLFFTEPLLANKFETIGGGVQGSTKVKAEYLQIVAYVAGGIFLVAGVLAIVLRDRNALTLNYTMWKSSSVFFFILSIGAFVVALLMN